MGWGVGHNRLFRWACAFFLPNLTGPPVPSQGSWQGPRHLPMCAAPASPMPLPASSIHHRNAGTSEFPVQLLTLLPLVSSWEPGRGERLGPIGHTR